MFRHSRTRFFIIAMSLCIILLAGCNASSSPESATKNALPMFKDWRVAYMGADNRVHAVSLDAKTDVAGEILPFALAGTPPILGGGILNAGIAADGHTLAYLTDQGFIITDLSSGKAPQILAGENSFANEMVWSLNGQFLLLEERLSDLYITQANSGSISLVPGSPFPAQPIPGGTRIARWQDATHVFLTRWANRSETAPYQVYSLDITSGKIELVASLNVPPPQNVNTNILPDGKNILYSYFAIQHQSDPTIGVYDIASGTSTTLPNLSHIQYGVSVGVQNLTWRPGTLTAALCTGAPVNSDLKDWLVDPLNNAATPLPSIGFPVAWTPDGKTLIFSSDSSGEKGGGPYTITALHFGDNGQMTQTVLTKAAMNFNFIGLVRTAGGA